MVAHIRAGAVAERGSSNDRPCMPGISICDGCRSSIDPMSSTTSPLPSLDPGEDGRVGTGDDPNRSITYWEYPSALSGRQFAGTMLVSWPGDQTYKTFEVAATRRMSGGWQANASLSFTKTDSQFDDRQALNPNSEINTVAKFLGVPRRKCPAVIFSRGRSWRRRTGSAGRESRRRASTSLPAAPRSGRSSSTSIHSEPFDFRTRTWSISGLRSGIRLGGSHTLEGRFDFFNVFNTNFVTGRNLRSGSTYLVPSSIILPRILQMGATYNF